MSLAPMSPRVLRVALLASELFLSTADDATEAAIYCARRSCADLPDADDAQAADLAADYMRERDAAVGELDRYNAAFHADCDASYWGEDA